MVCLNSRRFGVLVQSLALMLVATGARAANHVKFGVFKVVGTSPVFIAQDKGYFAAENSSTSNWWPVHRAGTAGARHRLGRSRFRRDRVHRWLL